MANDMARRPVRPLTERIAPIVKAFMRSNHITQVQLASELERDQSYVSERVTGKRAFTTDELDAIALLAEWEPRRFIQHLADSLNDSGSTGVVTRGPWPVGGVDDARSVASDVDVRDRGGDDGQG
ncbi:MULTISPECIES: helix-turn-helix domain-containing protein [unclassified Microbacterium]|uniref:helix-turn-helix domain-containing protein n=1 Tax=unclassified Microbacterium TaxID=2609290 RepID=UPI003019D278